MSLFEVCIAIGVLTLLLAGILAALLQSRRLTEGSIYQNSALTIVQGYLEQVKNMEFASLPYYDKSGNLVPGSGSSSTEVTTRIDEATTDPLLISSGSPPDLASITPGGSGPTGTVNNDKIIDINQTPTSTNDDLRLRLWVWIQDISDGTVDATEVRAITIIYHYRLTDGTRSRWFVGSVRNIRSAVPTF